MYETATVETSAMSDDMASLPPMETIRAATVIFTTVPILCVYPFLQKYFAQGIMVGSIKG
jgi:putative aldouronate transport system permease protein